MALISRVGLDLVFGPAWSGCGRTPALIGSGVMFGLWPTVLYANMFVESTANATADYMRRELLKKAPKSDFATIARGVLAKRGMRA